MSLIVIVDDRITNRQIFSRLAQTVEARVEVQAFGDPGEALGWLATRVPDLVITDYKMPGLDGADFTRLLHQTPGCRDVPVIVLTAYEDRSFRLRALEAGATDFLLTPVDHQEFLTRARNLLRLGRQQRIIEGRARELERELLVSERSREATLRDSSQRLAQVIDTIPAMISAVDVRGRCTFANAYRTSALGASEERPERLGVLDRLVLESGQPVPGFEEEIIDRNGISRIFLTSKFPMRDPANVITSVLTTSFDISDRKHAESHLHHLAHYDALTGLPNRMLLHNRLREELARSRRGGRSFALLFLDLDRFKSINDTLGHQAGDLLLKAVGDRLHDVLRAVDTVARLGGDEFAILQPEIDHPDDAARLADRVVESMGRPFLLGERQIITSISIGITFCPRDGDELDQLLKNADLAMYRAKAEGRSQFRFFTTEMQTHAHESVLLEFDLRRSLERGELLLHYQPQVRLDTGEMVGVEALLRWQRPSHGLLAPDAFLGLAEESGLIVPINTWVLQEACNRAADWQRRGTPLRVGVNVSAALFRKRDMRQVVTNVLSTTGLDPSLLELELTETMLMENPTAVAEDLRALQELGVGVAIDDFGTGYSSLSYLKVLPVNRLKIDKSFIANMRDESSDLAIVHAILSIGRSLALEVIAEGVETEKQRQWLRAEGCQEAQGYFYSRPLQLEHLEALLDQTLQRRAV